MTQSTDNDVVVVAAARTPFGTFGGSLRDLSIPELAALAGAAAIQRAGIDPDDVEEYALGVNLPGSDRSIARQAALQTGPLSVSQPLIVVVDPAVAIVLSVWMFDERFTVSSAQKALAAAAFCVMALTVTILSRSAPTDLNRSLPVGA